MVVLCLRDNGPWQSASGVASLCGRAGEAPHPIPRAARAAGPGLAVHTGLQHDMTQVSGFRCHIISYHEFFPIKQDGILLLYIM